MASIPWICRSCSRSLGLGYLAPPSTTIAPVARRFLSFTPPRRDVQPALLRRAQSLTREHDALQKTLLTEFEGAAAKRAGELSPVATALKEYEQTRDSITELSTMMQDPTQDAELVEIAREELETEKSRIEALERKLEESLTPKHPYADFPCMVEIRPGPGGLEGRFFADSIFKMYKGLCVREGYRFSVVKYELLDGEGQSSSLGEQALQEAVLEIHADGAFNIFRTESGMHRVQRIPDTEKTGRTHTSAVAVWVLPSFPEQAFDDMDVENPESDFYIDPQEVKIETMRARGAGGQHVNKTESAIRMTHIPTGTVVSMQDNRSQARNRETAWKLLRSRLADQRREAREAEAASLRDSVLSSKQITRGDKIRTYNYQQDRCTDHRAGLGVNNLPGVLEGGEGLGKVMEAARGWMVGREIEILIKEEEVKAKSGK